jgi:seryl-tRNA synthetase
MLDIKFLRENPELVKENIKKKFRDGKLPLVDKVIELDEVYRCQLLQLETTRADVNKFSKEIGSLMAQGKKDDAEQIKAKVALMKEGIQRLEKDVAKNKEEIHVIMSTIPQMIAGDVPPGKDDSENVEVERFGNYAEKGFDIPYHVELMESFGGLDLDSARKTSGNGFYYLKGDIARLHSAILSYARDFMIDKGFEYYIPPIMIRSAVVSGVMSFAEMDNMMYKIEGEDLYLIGTSEHSMIGKFMDEIIPEEDLPQALTSYSPCFRKEVGAHGIEERGVYRIHQFEKQEMIVVCKPEDSLEWFGKLWKTTVEFFLSLGVPVRALECCSGDLADLKVKSIDVEAWSPRLGKFFEVGSCSTLGDAQARRLGIRIRKSEKEKYFAHTLNNTVVAPPRMLIYFLENNLNADGSVSVPEPLRAYLGGQERILSKKGGV